MRLEQIRSEFPILDKVDYLNHAGIAPIPRSAADQLRKYAELASTSGNLAPDWYDRAISVKAKAAKLINARGAHEIAFIPNTSTGISLVARGLEWKKGDKVIVSDVEFPANRYPWEDLRRFGVSLVEIPQDVEGRITAESVISKIDKDVKLVALSHVQYISGYRQDFNLISQAIHEVGGYLFVDAIQSLGAVEVDVNKMGADFLAADGHKWLLGPEGAGIFYCREDRFETLHPAIIGWLNMVEPLEYDKYRFEFDDSARRFEPGTNNIPGLWALNASMELLLNVGIGTIEAKIKKLTGYLCELLADKGYKVVSPREENQFSGIVSFELRPSGRGSDIDPVRVLDELRARNIIIAMRGGRFRASPHFYNNDQQLERLVSALP